MRIERSSPVRQEYQKTEDRSAPSKTFGQIMQARAQDRYVPGPSAQSFDPEVNFSLAERKYGNAALSIATCAKLKQLAEIDQQADYTGMSADEIYAEIWNRYDEAFDGNMIAIKAYIAGPIEWERIHNQFYDEVCRRVSEAAYKAAGEVQTSVEQEMDALEGSSQKGTGNASYDAFMKVLGYDGMSFEEKEAAIKKKYAGKNTTLDFLKMQSELKESGVLEHKMGSEASTYCAMLEIQFEYAFNPDYTKRDGPEDINLRMSTDQWNRIANQPFDTAKLSSGMKAQLGRISGPNKYSSDIVKLMEDCIDRFIGRVIDGGMDQLISELKKITA